MRRQHYRLRADRYSPGGNITSRLLPPVFAELVQAMAEAQREQTRADARGEPVTVQVIDCWNVPVWRMGMFDPEPSEEAR
jgi:hypothetical protein